MLGVRQPSLTRRLGRESQCRPDPVEVLQRADDHHFAARARAAPGTASPAPCSSALGDRRSTSTTSQSHLATRRVSSQSLRKFTSATTEFGSPPATNSNILHRIAPGFAADRSSAQALACRSRGHGVVKLDAGIGDPERRPVVRMPTAANLHYEHLRRWVASCGQSWRSTSSASIIEEMPTPLNWSIAWRGSVWLRVNARRATRLAMREQAHEEIERRFFGAHALAGADRINDHVLRIEGPPPRRCARGAPRLPWPRASTSGTEGCPPAAHSSRSTPALRTELARLSALSSKLM